MKTALYGKDDIIEFHKEQGKVRLCVGGILADKATLSLLQDEAKRTKESRLEQLVNNRLKTDAMHRALKTSKNWEEVLAAKASMDAILLRESILQATLDAKND